MSDTGEPAGEATGAPRVVLVPVPSRTAPHKLLLLVTSTVLGVFYSIGLPPPTSVAATQPVWVIRVWAAAMLLAGAAGLAGSFWRGNLERGLLMESGAMDVGTAAMLFYAGCLIGYSGLAATGPAVTFTLWAAANIWRRVQIGCQLKDMTHR